MASEPSPIPYDSSTYDNIYIFQLVDYCIEHYEIEKIHFLNDTDIFMMSSVEELETDLSVRKIINLYLDSEMQSSMYIPLPKDILHNIMEGIKKENCPKG